MSEQSNVDANSIEVRIESVPQIFNTFDPSPFRERELKKEAEEFIVSWARELPSGVPLKIRVHLPEDQLATPGARDIGPAITQFFDYQAEVTGLELKDLFRVGRYSLAIGATVLVISILASQAISSNLSSHSVARVIAESLLIFAWVANWRPIEIFLYEWWPIARRRNLYRRLSAADIELRPLPSR